MPPILPLTPDTPGVPQQERLCSTFPSCQATPGVS
jgi:hypothetical protein